MSFTNSVTSPAPATGNHVGEATGGTEGRLKGILKTSNVEMPVEIVQSTQSQKVQASTWQNLKQGVMDFLRQMITFFHPSTENSKEHLNSEQTLKAFDNAEKHSDIMDQARHQLSRVSTVLTRHGLWDVHGSDFKKCEREIEKHCREYQNNIRLEDTCISELNTDLEKLEKEMEVLTDGKSHLEHANKVNEVSDELAAYHDKKHGKLVILRESARSTMADLIDKISLLRPN